MDITKLKLLRGGQGGFLYSLNDRGTNFFTARVNGGGSDGASQDEEEKIAAVFAQSINMAAILKDVVLPIIHHSTEAAKTDVDQAGLESAISNIKTILADAGIKK